MLGVGRLSALHVVCIGVIAFAGPARAGQVARSSSLSEVTLPGGLEAALAAIGDRTAPDRSQFLIEFIRRTQDAPIVSKDAPRNEALRRLLAHLDRVQKASDLPVDTLPLPLSAGVWTKVVFGGKVTAQNLAVEILRSRNAALLYYGLLSLDDETRDWLAAQPDLVADLAVRYGAAFAVAAPGLRVAASNARLPGGNDATPVWEDLAGRRANEPAQFVRALLSQRDGRLAWFVGTMAQLSEPQVRAAMQLDATAVADRVAAARRLLAVFERVAPAWKIADRAFWRPAQDPALLIADLKVDKEGRPLVLGTQRFWRAVFAPPDQDPLDGQEPGTLVGGAPADVVWLCEQVFEEPVDQRRRYRLALFASRVAGEITPESARDTVEAVRAASQFPALSVVLERAHVTDVSAIARAARRAALLSSIGDDAVAVRSLTQFQGTLAALTRAALRGSLSRDVLTDAVSAASAIDLSPRGEYEGRMVLWIADWLRVRREQAEASRPRATGPSAMKTNGHDVVAPDLDIGLLRMLAGPQPVAERFVDWEGTRYRVDLTAAETARLEQFLGDSPRPYLTSAYALAAAADVLAAPSLTRQAVRQQLDEVGQALERVGLHDPAVEDDRDTVDRYRDLVAALQGARSTDDVGGAARLVPTLRSFADDLTARGLLLLSYAVALGQPDSVPISASAAASRHDFGRSSDGSRQRGAWQLPQAGSESRRGWHVAGSLLALDVRLAEFSLLRLSARPPAHRPTLNDEDRRVLIETAVLVEPAALTDADRDMIAAAIRRGRESLAAVRTPAEAIAVADQVPLSPSRRTLLAWAVTREPERVATYLSPAELMWLGLGRTSALPPLNPWGVSSEARLGCVCTQMIDRRPWEALSGRWTWGMMASGFPDLNLRLAELLAELRMPGVLLGPVLAAATLDLINGATSRDPDDRRGPVEFVQSLTGARVEEYLALLTTDGPLVPIDDAAWPAASERVQTRDGGRQ